MTYGECEQRLKLRLQALYDAGEAASIADWVLEDFTDFNRNHRRLHSSQEIDNITTDKIEAAIQQLLQHRPLQYVLGYAFFYGYKFWVNESVLIPRPETEELVQWIIDAYKTTQQPFTILDIGTGSGCIPIALQKQLPLAQLTSIDISETALETAKKNANDNEASVSFQQLDFLNESNWTELNKYDIIVSNPPYIPLQEKSELDKNVTDWEPATALFVPNDDPLIFYEKIALFGKVHLQNSGSVFMETHKDYANNVQQLFTKHGYRVELKKDMHGNDRMVKATIVND
jgi:release factor glutamine methyltransferase